MALSIVVGRPALWLIGALGFLLRGGSLLLVVPIVVVPTLVEARLMLGANLGSDGFAPGFLALLVAVLGLLCLPLFAALLLAARAEVDAFEVTLGEPEAAELHRADVRPPEPARRYRLVGQIFGIQLGALLVLAAATVPLANAIVASAMAQILRPTGAGDIYVRVLSDVRQPLIALVVILLLVELLSASLTRGRLVNGFGLGAGIGRLPLLRQPLAAIATGLAGWLVMLAALLPSLWLIGLTWQQVRSTYLSLGPTGDPGTLVGLAVVTAGLVVAFLAGLLLTGFASALRTALWTAESLG